MKINIPVTVYRVGNGELIFDGLKSGFYEISNELIEWVMELSDEGALWPYKAHVIGHDCFRDVWVVRLDEVG